MDMEILGGDPSMELHTEIPVELSFDYPECLYLGENMYPVTVWQNGAALAGARVCLIKSDAGDNVRGFGFTNKKGIATIILDPAPEAPDILQITVTATNSVPLETSGAVCVATGPWLNYQSHQVDDSTGNGDGMINPGETIIMPVTLLNVGLETATGVVGTLSSTSPFINITDATATFPDFAIGQTGQSNPDHFAFEVASTTPNAENITFTLDWNTTGGFNGSTHWTVQIVKPDLVYADHQVNDDSGNDNGYLDPGESVQLEVSLLNQGGAEASGITAVLSEDSLYVTISDDQAVWPDLAPSQTAFSLGPHFSLSAAPDTPRGHVVHCQLEISTLAGYEFSTSFNLIAGINGQVLVIDDNSNGSSTILATTLTDMFYRVTSETASITDPLTWSNYDFIVHASGNNYLSVPFLASDLINYVQNGGRLLIEGGEVLHDLNSNTQFKNIVLHCQNYSHSYGQSLAQTSTTHPISTTPHLLPANFSVDYYSMTDHDTGVISSDAIGVYDWTQYPGQVGIIAYDNDPDLDNGGQIVFCSFNLARISNPTLDRDHLIENMAHWLRSTPDHEVPTLSRGGLILTCVILTLILCLASRQRNNTEKLKSRLDT
ncbi:hypothetical protein JXQ70_05510 [bacterium]|nr:hypothetical protein [bacterium]